MSSGLYDPPKGHSGESGENKINQTKAAIDEATSRMRDNVGALGDRGARLDNLQEQSANLSNNAHSFNRRANHLRKEMWWKDMKMRVCIIVGIIILLVVIIVPSVVATKGH